ncbi:hypothetical protein NCC49_002110 [Naganishia albida]|nr:hypothetical protein NCC49_002110 [Naganishia albida]
MSPEGSTWQAVLQQTLAQKTDYSVAFALATTRADGRPNVRHVGLKDVISLPLSTSTGDAQTTSAATSSAAATSSLRTPLSALLFSTDIRSPKCQEITENSACALSAWLAQTGVQFRIDGHAYLYRPLWTGNSRDEKTWTRPRSSLDTTPTNLKAIQETVFTTDLESLSRSMFEELSPRTRAWHSRGVPGGRINDFAPTEREAWLQELTRLLAPIRQAGQAAEFVAAARNFALLIVVPYEVDVVQIVSQGHDRRWQWRLREDLTWEVIELVP